MDDSQAVDSVFHPHGGSIRMHGESLVVTMIKGNKTIDHLFLAEKRNTTQSDSKILCTYLCEDGQPDIRA
jgi:hypothetical protein